MSIQRISVDPITRLEGHVAFQAGDGIHAYPLDTHSITLLLRMEWGREYR